MQLPEFLPITYYDGNKGDPAHLRRAQELRFYSPQQGRMFIIFGLVKKVRLRMAEAKALLKHIIIIWQAIKSLVCYQNDYGV